MQELSLLEYTGVLRVVRIEHRFQRVTAHVPRSSQRIAPVTLEMGCI